MDIPPIWSEAQKAVEERVGPIIRQTWFDPIKPRLQHPHTLLLEMPDAFFKEWFERHYSALLREVLNGIEPGLNISLSVIAEPSSQQLAQAQNPPQAKSIAPAVNLPHINPRYSFENFIVGSSNRFAHAAALAIVDAPAKAYNPLSIYGGVGLGKTHLMQAICLASFKRNPKIKIAYTTSESFTNELIEAIRGHSTNAFRAKYRSVDILLIDDVQFIAGKESTQEEFFHTFNTLYDNHKQIIMSSDRPSKEIPNLQERLISRFSWGLVTDIQPPDFETRVAILRKKIELEPFKVPDEVISFIAERIKTNIRELEGALIRVVAYSSLEERAISLHLAQEVLKDMLKETKKTVTIELIQRSVADFFSLSVGELKNKKRNKQLVLPRQIAMHLTRELTNHSLPDIGEAFGGKDHTTVLYACNKIKREIKEDKKIADIVYRLATDIKS